MQATAPASAADGRPIRSTTEPAYRPKQDAADPVAGDEQSARARPEGELVGRDEHEHEADGGEAEVAEHRLGGQERDPPVQQRAERGARRVGGRPLGRAERLLRECEDDGDHRHEHEREPPVDLAEDAAEDGREA